MERSWVVKIREQCEAAKVPFFFKQWGGIRKGDAGRKLDGCTYDEMPVRPEGKVTPQKMRLALIETVKSWDCALQPT